MIFRYSCIYTSNNSSRRICWDGLGPGRGRSTLPTWLRFASWLLGRSEKQHLDLHLWLSGALIGRNFRFSMYGMRIRRCESEICIYIYNYYIYRYIKIILYQYIVQICFCPFFLPSRCTGNHESTAQKTKKWHS